MTDATDANWTLLITSSQNPPAVYMHLTKEECEKLKVKLMPLPQDSKWYDEVIGHDGRVQICPKSGGMCWTAPTSWPIPVSAECFR